MLEAQRAPSSAPAHYLAHRRIAQVDSLKLLQLSRFIPALVLPRHC